MLFCNSFEQITFLMISKALLFRYTIYCNVQFAIKYESKIACRYFKTEVFSY